MYQEIKKQATKQYIWYGPYYFLNNNMYVCGKE